MGEQGDKFSRSDRELRALCFAVLRELARDHMWQDTAELMEPCFYPAQSPNPDEQVVTYEEGARR
jgi:hypothetical protein